MIDITKPIRRKRDKAPARIVDTNLKRKPS